MKTAIVYASVHHGNTYKIVKALEQEFEIELIDATKTSEKDLNSYDRIGFASGIYYGKFHQAVLNFAAVNLPPKKEVFYVCTYGGKPAFNSIETAIAKKDSQYIGGYSCEGFDTFGPFKLIGGLKKNHPNENDVENAIQFYSNLINIYGN